jgi:Protein of unknown function (DUF4238)
VLLRRKSDGDAMSGVDAPEGVVERIVGMRDELFDALQKTSDRLTSSATLPKSIYHFTDADGLIGIIQHRSLRGTLATALNDKSEMKVALEVAKGLVAARLKTKPTLFDRFFRTFIEKPAVFDVGKIPLRPGVISFCESADLSVHWTHYGRSGTGFALGFAPSKLSVGGLRVVKVIYGVEQQREVIRSLLAEASRVTLKTIQSMTKRGEIDHVLVMAAHMTAAYVNALYAKHFYSLETDDGLDTSVEKFFGTDVEGPAAEAMRRLVEGGRPIIAPGVRDPLALFLGFQRVRGMAYREMLVEHSKATARQLAAMATPSEVQRIARARGEEMTDEEAADLAEFGNSGEFTVEVGRPSNLHLGSILKSAQAVAGLLEARSWRLIEFADPVLVTSDEPLGFIGDDLRKLGSGGGLIGAREIVFPLDPRHALQMVRPDFSAAQGRGIGTLPQAAIFNLHVAFAAHRFIVRHPGTDPLRGAVLPKKAPPVFVVNGVVGMEQNATEADRAEFLAKVARGEIQFTRAPVDDDSSAA